MAKADYERLLKVNPASYNGRLGLATLEQKEGKHEDALRILNNMFAAKGKDAQLSPSQYAMLYVARAGVEKDLKHMDMALVDLEEAIRLDSSQPDIYLMRGEIYLVQKKKTLPNVISRSHIIRSTPVRPTRPTKTNKEIVVSD